MAELKKIGVMSSAKITAVIMLIIGFITSWFYVIAEILARKAIESSELGAFVKTPPGIGLIALAIFPLSYGLIGFISGAFGAFLYNIIAGLIGGLKLEFEEVTEASEQATEKNIQEVKLKSKKID